MIEIPQDKIEIGQPRNADWQALKGRENRYPNQFGAPMLHEEGLVPEEVTSLKDRGVIFPLEIAEPARTVMFKKEVHI